VPVSMHESAHSFIIDIASLYDCSIGFVNWSVNVIYLLYYFISFALSKNDWTSVINKNINISRKDIAMFFSDNLGLLIN
jgi:hypothetical protein